MISYIYIYSSLPLSILNRPPDSLPAIPEAQEKIAEASGIRAGGMPGATLRCRQPLGTPIAGWLMENPKKYRLMMCE